MEVIIDDLDDIHLTVGHLVVEGITNKKNRNGLLEREVKKLENELQKNPKKFLENKTMQSYNNFTPSANSAIQINDSGAQILIRLVLNNGLPTISRVVDCMNIISIKTGLTISVWNKNKIKGDIIYKLSKGGEKYHPFMGQEVELLENELIAADDEKALCLVRYRDSQYAPVTIETKDIIVHIQGVNNISEETIKSALDSLERMLLATVGGVTTDKRIIKNN